MEKRILELIAFYQAENFGTPEVIYLNEYDLLIFEGEILNSLPFKAPEGSNLSHFHGIKVKQGDIPQGEILIG